MFASEDLLDANPGRPGAPISIPGYPIETASSGIKAPQYFAPGVAGDHGEPIAQFVQVGSYLVPNNLSANAHGNGYADPNIYIANVIESVQVDGGAFNVREGNHALNLATTYALRSHLDPFFTLTGDQRDITGTAGLSPSELRGSRWRSRTAMDSWTGWSTASSSSSTAGRSSARAITLMTLFGIGYYGFSYVAGLSPIYGFNSVDAANGWTAVPGHDRSAAKGPDPHGAIALNDVWKLAKTRNFSSPDSSAPTISPSIRTSATGLIRQSEFRTVTGGSAVYKKKFSKRFTLLAGTDYEREAPRRDDLDHYNFYNPAQPYYYGPFIKVDGNNVTITPVTPYIAARGRAEPIFSLLLGLRRDEILIDNQDLVTPANSSNKLVGLNSPKATLTFFPKESWCVPEVAVSFGKSFFTEDPTNRIGCSADSTGAPKPWTRWRRRARINWSQASASTRRI